MNTGECILTQHSNPLGEDWLTVARADPRARIAAELVERFRDVGALTLVGDVLTIRARNRTVVYVIGHYDPLTDTYAMEWPD